MNRPLFIPAIAVLACAILTSTHAQEKKEEENFTWHDVSTWGIEGRGWPASAVNSYYDRLPAKAEKIVRPPVWSLSRHSAGMMTRFNTDSTEIRIRYELGTDRIDMPHMPATGVSGVDLYALDAEGNWRWVEVARPSGVKVEQKVTGLDAGKRSYQAYLPLYNSMKKIEIGVRKDSLFEPVKPREEKPILFYGTSITHGASASRPGMPHPAILGRRLGMPVINLGFSGNGKMEPEVGALLAEIDPAVYVIDCLPNMTGPEVAERAEPLVKQLRQARPDTPIVLVEDRTYANTWIMESKRKRHDDSRAALVRAFDNLVSSGVRNLYYLEGKDLLGSDGDGTTDGSHPNDLGFVRQADAFEPVLRKALGID